MRVRQPRAGIFLGSYFAYYSTTAIYISFMTLYFKSLGYDGAEIGFLTSFPHLLALLTQPIWGAIGDRAKSKNRILILLALGIMISIAMMPLSKSILWVAVIMVVYMIARSNTSTMLDTITFEMLPKTKINYGWARAMGSIGFAIMSVVAGQATKGGISNMFPLYIGIMAVFVVLVLFIPRVEGHQRREKKKVKVNVLLKNPAVRTLCISGFLYMVPTGFFHSFFSIYFTELGGTNNMLGWAMCLAPLAEIPFLFLAQRIYNKLGAKNLMVMAAGMMTLRWLLLGLACPDTAAATIMQPLQGIGDTAYTFVLVSYMNEAAPLELKASGQALVGLSTGIATMSGSFLGGILSDFLPLATIFAMGGGLTALAVVALVVLFPKRTPMEQIGLNMPQN